MKINKHISIVLALLVLVSNAGLAFNLHYCGGQLAAVSLEYKVQASGKVSDSSPTQSCCGDTEESTDCCSNDKIDLKKSLSDEVIVKSIQLDLPAFTLAETWEPLSFGVFSATATKSQNPSFYCNSNAPPLYKLHCQYIFYDTL